MMPMPVCVIDGSSFCPCTPGLPRTPNIRGIEGPVMSPSRMPTRKP